MKKNMFSICGAVSGLALTLTATAPAQLAPVNVERFLREFGDVLSPTASPGVFRVGGGLQPGIARPPLHVNLRPFAATGPSAPYSPGQIRHAYGIDLVLNTGVTGKGQTIGIVDAYGDPSLQTDLNNFCNYYGIASTTVTVLYPEGKPRFGNSGWALETALDVEWAHAIAPGANIVVWVAKSASLTDLLGAVDAAVKGGANVVSMSWGSTEFAGEQNYDSHFGSSAVTFVASSGDSGELTGTYQAEWPAASPCVVGIGGTSLYLNPDNTRSLETAWSGGGGGVSAVYGQQTWQSPFYTGNRGVPDVSYVADPNTGVGVAYGRYLYWVGGTSVGAPQWAALVALANSYDLPALGNGPAAIYGLAGSVAGCFFDITSGSNGSDGDDSAGPGYDLVTGLGSPVANVLVPNL